MTEHEVVAPYRPRWQQLSPDAQRRLAARWVDHCVARVMGAQHTPITDETTMLQAEVALSRRVKSEGADTAAIYALLGQFELLKGELLIEEAAFMLVLTSPHARRLLEEDLPALPTAPR